MLMNRIVLAIGLALSLAVPVVHAQDGPESAETLLEDFIHYIIIDRPDLARLKGDALAARGLSNQEFVGLVEASSGLDRFRDAIAKAQYNTDLKDTADTLDDMYTTGRLERARDPAEIARNIPLLTGNQTARRNARERLVRAGEYAMPQLLNALLQRDDAFLRAQVHRLMIDMSRQAIVPLATALPHLEPADQELVIDVLGNMQYRTPLPVLTDVRDSTDSPRVREACQQAIDRIGRGNLPDDAALLYLSLGEGYYAERADLTSFPDEDVQLYWRYEAQLGLLAEAVLTDVFHEAMAMRAAERSLTLASENPFALSLWLAANLKREIESPAGYDNPTYAADRRDAMYYAIAAGAGPSQRVLARALDTRNTQLARDAIAAIERTAGEGVLWSAQDGRTALLDALAYPNRRVQYEAALALGKASPTAPFEGSVRVVPLLASAIRDASDRFAVVIAADRETYQSYRGLLESMGYQVVPFARSLAEAAPAIAELPGVDLVVVEGFAGQVQEVISSARASSALAAAPLLGLTAPRDYAEIDRQYSRDPSVMVRSTGMGGQTLQTAISTLVDDASGGPITEAEATEYTDRAIAVLRDLAVSGNRVLNAADATLPLIGELLDRQGEVRLRLADILSHIDEKRAQVALMDVALRENGAEMVRYLEKTSDSAKRFGNLLNPTQLEQLADIAMTGNDAEATAAAALMGALNLPNEDLVPLILGN